MNAEILFLGTGGDSIVVGKQLRASGGIIIRVDDNQFHIDPGPGAVVQAIGRGVNPRENTAVLVTHNHINHCNDANAVIEAMTFGGIDKIGVLVSNKTVYNGTEELPAYLTNFHKGCVEKSLAIESGQRLGINEIEILSTRAVHSDPNTIGLKFFTSKFTLSYTSDTQISQDVMVQYRESDILILNVQNPSGLKEHNHMNSDDAITFIKTAKPKLAIITHFGIKMLNADILQETRRIQKETKVQVVAATDGMSIDPTNYSANLRTKTLNLY
ncbi:MAG: MBL fold metallo-hydrolase [archaeon]